MGDTTAISITAIAVAGVAGPVITGAIQIRLARRRQRHERELRDVGEVRRLVDSAVASLFDVEESMATLRHVALRHGHRDYRTDRGPYAEPIRALWSKLGDFRRRATRLAIRVGPHTELSRIAQDATDHAVELLELVDQSIFMEEMKPEDVGTIFDQGKALEGYRKRFVELAHQAALAALPEG